MAGETRVRDVGTVSSKPLGGYHAVRLGLDDPAVTMTPGEARKLARALRKWAKVADRANGDVQCRACGRKG